ncbi:MAG: DUF63 family protein [Candidatus Nanoarchaeia archaeon]
MLVIDFINKYYLEPLRFDEGYNLVNSITYALIAFALLYVIYKGLEKTGVKVNFKFFIGLLPFIILGSSIRAFVDHEFYKYNFWTVSPGIYLLITGIFLLSLAFALILQRFREVEFWKTLFGIGLLLVVINFAVVATRLQFENLGFGAAMVGLAALVTLVLYFVFKKLNCKWAMQKTAFLPFAAHMLDASATFIAVDFLGAIEKHPIPVFMTNLTGTAAVMYLLKFAVLIPAVWLISKEVENKNLRNYLLIAIATLGLAEGLRDLLTMILV